MAEWGPMLVILFFSIVVHEYAHGVTALRCGDPTALHAGRLTLNPLPHIDPVGTILVPAMLIMSGSGFLFGWAKPVPVNPYNLRNPRLDSVKVSAAGPISNLLLAGIAAVLWIACGLFFGDFYRMVVPYLNFVITINVLLAVFNMLPIPPLDGSHILEYFLSPSARISYDRIKPYGFVILIVLMMTGMFSIVYTVTSIVVSIYKHIIYMVLAL